MEKSMAVLNLIGCKWTYDIMAAIEVEENNLRFNELMKILRGISPRILSLRLRQLREYGILEKNGADYALSEWGADVLFRIAPLLDVIAQGVA